jgi:hypothetical protein
MLLTDACPNSIEDLRVYESSILDVAVTEFIDLKVKLELAVGEVSEDVMDALLDRPLEDPRGPARRLYGLSDVVVTPQLKRWHAVHTLAVVYRDAFHNQLNDRYQAKFGDYKTLEGQAREHTLRFGIGLVSQPLPKAAQPSVSFATNTVAGATYYLQVAWVAASGAEGAPSEQTAWEAPAGSVPVVNAGSAPAGVTGFNVFIGLSAGTLALQNPTAIPVGQTFQLPTSGVVAGRAPTGGQAPDVFITFPRLMRRG